ncbi:hypothetical protein BDR06DRAFT_1035520 [Suillus hirtellus]|nr:hypothetical protein BDR06DRAFT_1035520 [Suillus hirtellus]
MIGKANAALEEQTIKTVSKKHKNNSSRDSGNMNLKKAKKTLLPSNTPTNGIGSMDEDELVDKNRRAIVHTEEEENALYKDDEMAEDELCMCNNLNMATVLIISSANSKEKVMYFNHQHSGMMNEVYNEDRFLDKAEL